MLCYNAEQTIQNFLNRICNLKFEHNIDFLILDDCSKDNTSKIIEKFISGNHSLDFSYQRNEENLGFGGNLKKAYDLAINKDYKFLSILHGDGQYPPEFLDKMYSFLSKSNLVLGSRMIVKKNAIAGKMPIIRFLGNIFLSNFQNLFFNTKLSEWHTGFRGINIEALKKIPYHLNSNYFDIDTQILIQFIIRGHNVSEFAIPTYYDQEKSGVNVIKYGLSVVFEMFLAKLTTLKLINIKRYQI